MPLPDSKGHFGIFGGRYVPETLIRALDELVAEYRGSFSAEHGIGPYNRAIYERFTAPEELRLAGALQRLVNPDARLGVVNFGST